MADLPTNYLDDILAQSMNGKRKYRITRADGTFEEVSLEDVSEYEQVGSNFGAGDINRTNQAVNEKFDSGDVVDPMLTTEPGFAADAYQTKLQFDEQNKKLGVNFDWENSIDYKGQTTFTPPKTGMLYIGVTANAQYGFVYVKQHDVHIMGNQMPSAGYNWQMNCIVDSSEISLNINESTISGLLFVPFK